jgi:Thioesterase-like superfamily
MRTRNTLGICVPVPRKEVRGRQRRPGRGSAPVAVGRTVPDLRPVLSLRPFILRSGDPDVPILYTVDRIRDGRSFTMRRMVAVQHATSPGEPGPSNVVSRTLAGRRVVALRAGDAGFVTRARPGPRRIHRRDGGTPAQTAGPRHRWRIAWRDPAGERVISAARSIRTKGWTSAVRMATLDVARTACHVPPRCGACRARHERRSERSTFVDPAAVPPCRHVGR